MSKQQPGISIDSDIWERFKIETGDNAASHEIEKLMEWYVDEDGHQSENQELDKKIQKLRNRLEELEDKEDKIRKQKTDLQKEIQTLEAKKEARKQKEEDRWDDAVVIQQ